MYHNLIKIESKKLKKEGKMKNKKLKKEGKKEGKCKRQRSMRGKVSKV